MKSSTKILITGAAGFIGSHLVELLLEQGEPLSRLKLFIPNNESLGNLPDRKFDIVRGDIRDKQAVKKATEGVDAVYHLAARIDFDGKTYQDYKDVNVDGTWNLLDACKKNNLQKFVFFSSIGVFGMPADVGDIEGWNESHPKTYSNYYGQSKWEGEKVVMQAFEKWNIPYAIVRPASVYGPREKGPTLGLYKTIKNNQFMIIGNGKNLMHYVFVKDLVKGARLAQLSKQKKGDYILAGPQPTPFKEVAGCVAESIGKTLLGINIPKSIALPVSYVLDAMGKVVGVKSPLFPSRVRTMTTTYYYDIHKAKNEIRYDPQIDFCKGAEITGKWYQQNGWI